MNWNLIIDSATRKQLKKIPRKTALNILSVIESLSINPYAGDMEKMEGEKGVWRRRVGSYRIFYEIYSNKKVIYVFCVKRRTSKIY